MLLCILKIIGIVLLCILLLVLCLLLLVLFVPVRYQVKGVRKEGDDVPVRAEARITWFLHVLNASFRYPQEAYLRVRIFCFTIFSTGQKEKTKARPKTKREKPKKMKASEDGETGNQYEKKRVKKEEITEKKPKETDRKTEDFKEEPDRKTNQKEASEEVFHSEADEEIPTLFKFFRKLFHILKNIKYTICQICDKIKHVIRNIRYYMGILERGPFQNAWQLCSREVLSVVRSILPKKVTGSLTIGTGDPASTARILSLYGILYPLIGNHINIIPDFDNSILEGDFFIKGKITVFKLLKTAIKIYFNEDLRKVIRLVKKEAA